MNNATKTTNIVLSRDYWKLIDLVKGTIKKEEFLASEGAILNSNQSNFVSLTHDFAFNQGGSAKTHQIIIEINDVENNFNEKFILASLKAKSIGSRKDLNPLAALNYESLEKLKAEAEAAGFFGYINALYKDKKQSLPEELLKYEDILDLEDPEAVTGNPELLGLGDNLPEDPIFRSLEGFEEKRKKGLEILRSANLQLSSLIDSQLQAMKADIMTTQMFIMYGVGPNYESWAGPFICNLTNIDYKFNGSTGAKLIELTFTPFGSASLLNGDNVFRNGLGVLVSDIRIPIFRDKGVVKIPIEQQADDAYLAWSMKKVDAKKSFLQTIIGEYVDLNVNIAKNSIATIGEVVSDITDELTGAKAEKAKLGRLVGKFEESIEIIPRTRHSIFKSLMYQYVKAAVVDMDVLVLLPDMDKVTEQQYLTLRNVASKFILGINASKIAPKGLFAKDFFINCYSQTELFRSFGLSIVSNDNGQEFKGSPVPTGFIEGFGTYLGDSSVKNTHVALLKYPNQTYREPLDNIAKQISTNKYALEFDIEVIHNINFITEMAKIIKRPEITGKRPIVLVGDRAMFHKFLFGKKSLEDAGIIKYVAKPGTTEDPTALDDLLVEEDKVFKSEEYIQLAKKTFLSTPPEYPYDMESLPSDSFAFKDETNSEKLLKETGITVFRLGTENSNILDITSNISMAYFTALQQMWYSQTFSGRSHSGGLSQKPGPALDPGSSETKENIQGVDSITILDPKKIENQIKALNKDNKIVSELGITDKQFDELVASVVTLIVASKGTRQISVPISWESGGSTFVQFLRLLNIVNRSACMATIKTLPAFHLSDCSHSLPTALLILDEPGLVGKVSNYGLIKTMSGFWRIVGFEHKISQYDTSSSFHLVKDFSSGMPVLLDIPSVKETI